MGNSSTSVFPTTRATAHKNEIRKETDDKCKKEAKIWNEENRYNLY